MKKPFNYLPYIKPNRYQTYLQVIRYFKSWPEQTVANLLGISRSHYSNIERGVSACPDRLLQRIGKVLGVDMETLRTKMRDRRFVIWEG